MEKLVNSKPNVRRADRTYCGTLDWILGQRKNLSGKSSNIQVKPRVTSNALMLHFSF